MLKHKIPEKVPIDVASYLGEAVFKSEKDFIVRTPSAQFWNSLSTEQQEKWRGLITLLGEDPEDYLREMRGMFPKNPS